MAVAFLLNAGATALLVAALPSEIPPTAAQSNDTVDNIFAGEALEHLRVDVALGVLRESRRVLKPGGVITICVPDLECAIEQYLANQKQEALGYFLHDTGRGGLSARKAMWDYDLLTMLFIDAE